MAGAAGCLWRGSPAVEPAASLPLSGAAGSLVLRRMDRRGHKRGFVLAKKHGTESGIGAPLRRGFLSVKAGSSPTRKQ